MNIKTTLAELLKIDPEYADNKYRESEWQQLAQKQAALIEAVVKLAGDANFQYLKRDAMPPEKIINNMMNKTCEIVQKAKEAGYE